MRPRWTAGRPRRTVLALATVLAASGAMSGSLEEEIGRSEVRVRSAAYPLVAGRTVEQCALPARLERQGYTRVRERPAEPGQYFWGHDVFWVYRRAHRLDGVHHAASLIGLDLRREDGTIVGAATTGERTYPLEREGLLWLEPEDLAESLAADRAPRVPLALDDLPEHVWRAVLAAEDARFFSHPGVDTRSLARAALSNLKAGKVVEGGSTITQQLIKNRDLSPRRTLGRKLSEATRALMLEAEYPKREILQAYLNQVYLGHVGGLAVHGFGAGARTYFSKDATELTLDEAALLAGIIQGPNRLTPVRHRERARERRDWVLGRMEELGWSTAAAVRRARGRKIGLKVREPAPPAASHFVAWVAREVERELPARIERGRGVVLETTLDPYLQELAERAVADGLAELRRRHPRLRRAALQAALVALDAETGEVLAHVGGDPRDRAGEFDRARSARRQPGSTVKPLVLLEAFEDCGSREPLYPAARVLDGPLRIELADGPWEPSNHDGAFRGIVDVRRALADSRNVPFVRIARTCGMEPTAERMRRAGLTIPDDPPPSFALGAIEVSPLELAAAYTVFATPGRVVEPLPFRRVERPGGRPLLRRVPHRHRLVRPATAYLVRDLMRQAVEDGTAQIARIEGLDVAAKTGSTRDAWFAGHAGPLVAVVWVGLDDGAPLELPGAAAAGPIWRDFVRVAAPARPEYTVERPSGVLERFVNPRTGLLVRKRNRRAQRELFRVGALPPRNRFWKVDRPVPVIQ